MSGIESPFMSMTVCVRLPMFVFVPFVPPKFPSFVCFKSSYKSSPLVKSVSFEASRSALIPYVLSVPSLRAIRTNGKLNVEFPSSETAIPSML